MKLGRLIFGLGLLFAFIAPSALAQSGAQRLESIIIETFDDPDVRVWRQAGAERTEERRWIARGTRFATRDEDPQTGAVTQYPLVAHPETYPNALFDNNPDGLDLRVLGVQSKFDRQGWNRIEIYPTKVDEEGNTVHAPISMPGIVKEIDLWVWGSLYRYDLELHIRDYLGRPHVLNLGSLNFQGWRNIIARVPHTIPQGQAYLPKFKALELTKLVILTEPTERVDINFTYFDQIKILTDMHDEPFDGRELARESFVNQIEWKSPAGEDF